MKATNQGWRLKAVGGFRLGFVCVCLWPIFGLAKETATDPVVEVKCLLADRDIVQFTKRADLDSRKPLRRVECFFDTASLSLFLHDPKVILRSRYDSSGNADTTVKVRGKEINEANVTCELDKFGRKEPVLSCSMTDTGHDKAQIRRANGGKKLNKIFSKEQEGMLEETYGKVDWKKVRPYGPVKDIKVYKKVRLAGGPDLTVERWKLPARSDKPARVVLEVSAKVPLSREAETSRWIAGLARGSTTGSEQESETKTRIVLEHFKANGR